MTKTYLRAIALPILVQLFFFTVLSAQVNNTPNSNTQGSGTQNSSGATNSGSRAADDDGGLNTRISFMLGAGFSGILTDLYEEPVIDKVTNFVKIQDATALRTNLSLGIIYSPYIYEVSRQVRQSDGSYQTMTTNIAYGWSYALFINPVNLTAIANGGSRSNIDIGIGWGYRTSGGFTALLVAEFFPVKQPRDYFVEKYKGNDQPYTINNEIQTSIDLNDNSIFYNKVAFSVGFKLCYTFDIVKRFADAASN